MSEKDVVSQLLFISDVLTVTAEEAEIIKENIVLVGFYTSFFFFYFIASTKNTN